MNQPNESKSNWFWKRKEFPSENWHIDGKPQSISDAHRSFLLEGYTARIGVDNKYDDGGDDLLVYQTYNFLEPHNF